MQTASPPTAAAPPPRSIWRHARLLQSVASLLVIFIVAIVLSPHDRGGWPVFLTTENLTNMTRSMSEIGIIALAMTLVILTAGIDLSVGSVLALSATITAKLLVDWDPGMGGGMQITAALAAAVGACALVGMFNGFVISCFRVQPFVVTLAAMIGIRGVAKWLTTNKNIGIPFKGDYVSIRFADALSDKSVVIGIFLVLAALFGLVLARTVFGRYVRALGDNARASVYAGLPTRTIQITVYTISGTMAGLAGVLHAAQNRQGNPNDGIAYELDAIAAVVIGGTALSGGKGSIFGTVVGTLTLGIITNLLGLRGVDENVKWMTKAVIIVAAVLLQQSGSLGIFAKLFRRGTKQAQ